VGVGSYRVAKLELRRFPCVLEQKIKRFRGLDLICDAVHRPVLFKAHLHRRDGLPLLARYSFNFLIDLVPGGVNRLLGRDFR
jgi:hypothetical protein